jgi:hypothetical protein
MLLPRPQAMQGSAGIRHLGLRLGRHYRSIPNSNGAPPDEGDADGSGAGGAASTGAYVASGSGV